MLTQRAALTLLILVEAATFGFMSQTVIFPTAVALMAIVGWRRTGRSAVSPDRQVILSLIVALLFVVRWRVQPHILPDADQMAYLSPFLHSLGQFLLVLQVAALFLEYPRDVMPVTLPWPGVFVMVSAGDIHVQPVQRFVFQLCSLGFMAAVAIYFGATARAAAGLEGRTYRRETSALLAGVLACTAVVAWMSAAALQTYEHALDRLVGELLDPGNATSTGGFPTHSRLGSIARRKSERSQDVALRVYAADPPGYLRGKAYHFLTTAPGAGRDGTLQTQWEESPDSSAAGDSNSIAAHMLTPTSRAGNAFRYVLSESDGETTNSATQMDIWLEPAQWGTYFLPPHTAEIVTSENSLRRDFRSLTGNTDAAAVTYTARVDDSAERSQFFDMSSQRGVFSRATLLDYPAPLGQDPQIEAVVGRAFGDAKTFDEHVHAVETYFRSNYGYAIGIEIPAGKDPIRWFLVARPNAHCEYFAQAAALLLRLRGIPTRYMTGFVAAERNEYGGYWLARNEHAHAWCEAWDDERGWVVVEATPAAGVPLESAGAPAHRQLWEYLSGVVAEFRYRLSSGGWRWLARELSALILTPAGAAACLLAIVFALFRWRFQRSSREGHVPAIIAELQRIRVRVDQRVAKRGLVRRPGETLGRFADRVARETGDEAAARWYAAYADVRYAHPQEPHAVAALRDAAAMLGPLPRRTACDRAAAPSL